ncbi:MAG: outer membrane protein assembly factor BamD [Saprospiraceae bacterium]|nr:outer membrane protein assembly factor BamD [Saprospiraceae bacterium]
MKCRVFNNWLIIGLLLVGGSSCKSEFERIRSSGDPDVIYQEALKYYEEGDYLKSQTLLELVIPAFRGRPELEEVYFKYANTYYEQEKFILASYYFKNFSNTFPTSELREDADFMSAYSNYQLSPSFRLDQTYSENAIEGFQLFVNTYPDSDRIGVCNTLIDELRRKLEEKAYETGKLYFNLRQYQSATLSFENMLKDFPDTDNGEEVRFMIVRSAYLLADNSILEKRLDRFNSARKYASDFLRKYGESQYRDDVEAFLENSEKKIKDLQDVGYQEQGTGTRS